MNTRSSNSAISLSASDERSLSSPRRLLLLNALTSVVFLCWLPTGVEATTHLKPVGRVNDFAHVMSKTAVQQLERVLSELEERTTAEVAVVTVTSIEGGDVERAAVELFQGWGIGKKGKDNGVLILCAIDNRRVRIEVGYGLESVLTDAMSGRIIRERMVPRFRVKDYSGGLLDGTLTVVSIIARAAGVTLSDALVPPQSTPLKPTGIDWNIVFFIIIFVIVMLLRLNTGFGWYYYGGSGGSWGGGGGFSGGGFGGFGGGGSGGGGASGGW